MKKELENLGYHVLTKKVEFNGDTIYILLTKATDSYVGSFKMDDSGLVYSTDFRNISCYEMRELAEVFIQYA